MPDYERIVFGLKRTESTNRVLAFFVLNVDTQPHLSADIRHFTDLPRGNVGTILNHLTKVELLAREESGSYYHAKKDEQTILVPRPVFGFADNDAFCATLRALMMPYLSPSMQRAQNADLGNPSRVIMLPPRPK